MSTNEIEILRNQIASLRNRVADLERRPQVGMPYGPLNPSPNLQKLARQCSKCGLTLEGVMSYCCPHMNCPAGMGPISSMGVITT